MTSIQESHEGIPSLIHEPNSILPITTMLRVERDGNPQRRFGHASPFIGKLGPLNAEALRDISLLAASTLPVLPDSTLVIGMTESSLLLSWFFAAYLDSEIDLVFTTRERRSAFTGRTFQEPHSHGPSHFLTLPPSASYSQVVIIEDELTTGATLKNLLVAARDVSSRHYVVTLSDLRPPDLRERLRQEMAAIGIELTVINLSLLEQPKPQSRCLDKLPRTPRNPFGRSQMVLNRTLNALNKNWHKMCPSTLYLIGECVDLALTFWASLTEAERPCLRHVTRSPWLVDGGVVRTRLEFHGNPPTLPYFMYNWTRPAPPRVLILGEASTACIATKLSRFFFSQGIEATTVKVGS